jgi:tetratricopeptide (TPR) repeat protein
MSHTRLTESDYDQKLREMGNYLWDLEQQADLAKVEAGQAVADQIELTILHQAKRAHSFFQVAGSHRVLAAFVSGLAYRMIGRWRDATDHFLFVVERSPMNGEAWLELTWCLAELGRWEECELAARKSTEIFPKTPASWGNLALALGKVGKTNEAKGAIQRAIQLDPADARNRAIEEALA